MKILSWGRLSRGVGNQLGEKGFASSCTTDGSIAIEKLQMDYGLASCPMPLAPSLMFLSALNSENEG